MKNVLHNTLSQYYFSIHPSLLQFDLFDNETTPENKKNKTKIKRNVCSKKDNKKSASCIGWLVLQIKKKPATSCKETDAQTWVWMRMPSGKQGFLWAHFNQQYSLLGCVCLWLVRWKPFCLRNWNTFKAHIHPNSPPRKMRVKKKKIEVAFACLCAPLFHLTHTPLSCGSIAWILPGLSSFLWLRLRRHGGRRTWKKSLRFCFSLLPEVVVLGRQPSPIITDTGSIIRPGRLWFSAEAEMRSAVEPPDRLHTLCNASCYAASNWGLLSKTRLTLSGRLCRPRLSPDISESGKYGVWW